MELGSRIAFVARFLGRRLAYTYEIVTLQPGERLVMRTVDGPFPMETQYVRESTVDGGTRMTLRNRGAPMGFSALLAPFIARAMRHVNRKDLSLLKTNSGARACLSGVAMCRGCNKKAASAKQEPLQRRHAG